MADQEPIPAVPASPDTHTAHGFEIQAPGPGFEAQSALVLCVALLVGAMAGAIWRWRMRGGRLGPWSRHRFRLAGLILVVVLFPTQTDQALTSVVWGAKTSAHLIPAAVDAGLRCAVADDAESSGCGHTGVLAPPYFMSQSAALLLEEMGRRTAGETVDRQRYLEGVRQARSSQRWGVEHVPLTACAAVGTTATSSGLRPVSLLLMVLTALVGARGARALEDSIYAPPSVDEGDVDRAQKVRLHRSVQSARKKNLALSVVLGGGAYLAFAALAALGPFREARRLAESAYSPVKAFIEEDSTTLRHGVEVRDRADVDAFAAVLPRLDQMANLRWSTRMEKMTDYVAEFQHQWDASFILLSRFQNTVDKVTSRQPGLWTEPAFSDNSECVPIVVAIESPDRARILRSLNNFNRRMNPSYALGQSLDGHDVEPSPEDYKKTVQQFTSARGELSNLYVALAKEPGVPCTVRASVQQTQKAFALLESRFTALYVGEEDDQARTDELSARLHDLSRQVMEADERATEHLVDLDEKYGAFHAEVQHVLRAEQVQSGVSQRAGPGWFHRMERLGVWAEQSDNDARTHVRQCARQVVEASTERSRAVQSLTYLFPDLDDGRRRLSRESLDRRIQRIEEHTVRLGDLMEAARPACLDTDLVTADKPDEVEVASAYGRALGTMSGWLLLSDSLYVVLLVGMLGFGLLGAGLSRIVRRRLELETDAHTTAAHNGLAIADQSLVEDVPAVVFQGLGATLVVYLAALGGVGAISSQAPDLDPYVLMLSCFAASVFSEDVWRRTRDWFQARPDGNGTPPSDPNPEE